MPKLASLLCSFLQKLKKKKKTKKTATFMVGNLPPHLIISILTKMTARTFVKTYSSCRRIAGLADRGKENICIPIANMPSMAIEFSCLPELYPCHSYTLKISYPEDGGWSPDSKVAIHGFFSRDVEEIAIFLKNYSFFRFHRISVWSEKYCPLEVSKHLLPMFRREGLRCRSLLVDDPRLVQDFVRILKPTVLDAKAGFASEDLALPKRLKINITGFSPGNWSIIRENVLPNCKRLHLRIDESSSTSVEETIGFIERMFQLHDPKITVTVFLPRSVLHGHSAVELFCHLFNRIHVLDGLLLSPFPEAGCCSVLYISSGDWLLRTFENFHLLQLFLFSCKRFWPTHDENRANLDNLLQQIRPIFDQVIHS